MKCSLCGKTVEDGAVFCPFCGMQLGQEAPGAQAGANAPPEAPASEQQPAAAPGADTAEGPAASAQAGTAQGGPVPGMGAAPAPACRRIVTRRHMASPIPSCSRECPMGAQMGRLPA